MLNFSDGKCPSCEQVVRELSIDSITASTGIGQPQWAAATYCCPHCKVVLGAGIDPVAVKNDMIAEILQALGRK